MGKKRSRSSFANGGGSNVDAEKVEIFEDLGNANEEIRLKAAQRLLAKLSSAPSSSSSNEQQDLLEEYLRRLVRGLCSGRKAARVGFSVALTEVLGQFCAAGAGAGKWSGKVVDLLLELTAVGNGASGQEERDHHLGKLFGAEAIIKSKILFAPSSLSSPSLGTGTTSTSSSWERLLDVMFELAKSKTWLREEFGWVLFQALQVLRTVGPGIPTPTGTGTGTGQEEYAQMIIDKLNSNSLFKTTEGVALWIQAKENFPGLNFPKGVFKHEDPLHRSEIANLARILRETSDIKGLSSEEQKHAQKGNWFPNVHFAWEVALGRLIKPKKDTGASFKDLWKQAVDEGLFGLSASSQRKHWGFQLFQRYVLNGALEILPALFGRNFSRCLNNQIGAKESNLPISAQRALDAIVTRFAKDPKATDVLGKHMIELELDWSGIAKKETVSKMLSKADLDGLERLAGSIVDSRRSRNALDFENRHARDRRYARYLQDVVRYHELPVSTDSSTRRSQTLLDNTLRRLVEIAYGDEDAPKSLQDEVKARLTWCLTRIVAAGPEVAVFRAYETLLQVKDRTGKTFKADGDVLKSMSAAWDTLNTLAQGSIGPGKHGKISFAFHLLLIFTMLQVYDGEADAVSMIDELLDCSASLFDPRTSGSQDEGATLLVEIILSFASKPSKLFRSLVTQVFSAYTSIMNEECLKAFFEILETRENASGQRELFANEDEVEAEDDEMDTDGEDTSDAEDDSEETAGSSISEDENSDEEGAAELVEFDKKLAQALGTRRADEDAQIAEEESSDEDMDDAQMEALEPVLVNMFKQREEIKKASKKKEHRRSKEHVVLFKCRVLELLDIYVKQEYLKPLALSVVPPLLQVMRTTSDKKVSSQAGEIIKKYMKLFKLKADRATSESERKQMLAAGQTLLSASHAMAQLQGSNIYADACSRASQLAAKVMLSNGGNWEAVDKQYMATRRGWMLDPESNVKDSFFLDWHNWLVQARKTYQEIRTEIEVSKTSS